MRTFSLLKGQAVFETKSGNKVGEITDLCISESGKVTGLLVKSGAIFKHSCFLDIQDIDSFGYDGVMVEDLSLLEKVKDSPDFTLNHQNSLDGKMMLSKNGESLGLLKDVYFHEEMGTIVGYEITDGFFSEITEGKQVIESLMPPAIGKDAIIVDVKHT